MPTINFAEYIFNRQKMEESTSLLTAAQREAIKKIEVYWRERVHNMNNWKAQKHFTWKPESITTRVEENLYRRLNDQDKSRIIRNFVRKFLRDKVFREDFMGHLHDREMLPIDLKQNCQDVTVFLSILAEAFPKTISGWIPNVEKEILTFYFTFCTTWSLNWALRCALVLNAGCEDQKPIDREEVPELLRMIASESI